MSSTLHLPYMPALHLEIFRSGKRRGEIGVYEALCHLKDISGKYLRRKHEPASRFASKILVLLAGIKAI